MGSWEVRFAAESDVESIVAMNHQLAWESEKLRLDEKTLRAGVLRILRNPMLGRYFLAFDGPRVIGQMMINLEPTDWRDGVIVWLQSVYVAADYRRRGVFKTLYQSVKDHCRREVGPVRLIRLYMEQDNDLGRKTYEAAGMKKTHYVVYEAEPSL